MLRKQLNYLKKKTETIIIEPTINYANVIDPKLQQNIGIKQFLIFQSRCIEICGKNRKSVQRRSQKIFVRNESKS
jgi:hypothetical protein